MKNLLWIDCTAAFFAGAVVLILSGWLSDLHALPEGLLVFIGVVNLVYAGYSFSLAVRAKRSIAWIGFLVAANGFWAVVCLGLALFYIGSATLFGIGHLALEAVFVGGLAGMEWRWRELLLTAGKGTQEP